MDMNGSPDHAPGRWAVVLAGGEGERMKPAIRRWLGHDRPKQYCSFSGGKTLLEETVERALGVVPPERLVTLIGRGHRRHLAAGGVPPGLVIEQPAPRETAPGIFLAAAHVLRRDPSASLIIMPSDHFISPAGLFQARLRQAALTAERFPDKVVLLGARPDGPESDYGWIEPQDGWMTASGAMPVRHFVEKPASGLAGDLWARGALWNTFIMAVKGETLWRLGRRLLPEMMAGFDRLLPMLGTPEEDTAVAGAYERLPSRNFSRDVLELIPGEALVLPLEGVSWSDWGRPSRVAFTLARHGIETAVSFT